MGMDIDHVCLKKLIKRREILALWSTEWEERLTYRIQRFIIREEFIKTRFMEAGLKLAGLGG